MNKTLILSFIITCLSQFFVTKEAGAQICRVNVGKSTGGGGSYIEVFEYDYVSEKPQFPGGDSQLVAFINQNRVYPQEAYKKGIQGRVTCSFVINTDGTVSHVSILKGVEQTLNQEAIRIISKMPDWKPGRHGGQIVPVRMVWAVPFRK